MKPLKPIMFVGTGSDVGKSIIATALCRIFKQDGFHPAPFKAQNMALNSFAPPDGFEIGRAQAVQAEACGLPPHTDMNPLLLKPNSEHTTQVVLNGKPIGNRSAYEYFRKEGRETLRQAVHEAFDRLSARYNPIVMEGAGSVSEINLRDSDLVNMPMARYADANVILVADIDRGGVFASCYGSIMLQTPEDRKRIKGIIVNKFRGDIRLFESGRKMLEDICGVPVLGVVPMLPNINIEEEDSVALEKKQHAPVDGKINIVVVMLRHISNFTDFNILERDPRVNLFYSSNTVDIETADIIILPGTKSTLDDLLELRRNGVAKAIIMAHKAGKTIVGICGGFQMLGQTVNDPDGIEGTIPSLPGLGLLDIHTTMTQEKTTRQVEFLFEGEQCHGYEIHQGESTFVSDGKAVGDFIITDNVLGTYIHGILDNKPVIDYLLKDMATVPEAATVPGAFPSASIASATVPEATTVPDAFPSGSVASTTVPEASASGLPHPQSLLTWLCNPNNPTGHVIPKQRLLHDIASHPADIFVIDSSYAAYTDQDTPSALDIVSHDNAIMLCSMTKDYGVPGLRLGYIIANSRLLERVNSQRMPWSVNTLAIEAGKYLIAHCVEFQLPLATLLAERQRMEEEIHEIGILTSHSDSHMLLCQLPNGSARELKDYLANHHGILIRDASNFPTLTQQHFRIAVQTPDDNNQLISALKNYKSVNCK